MQSCVFRSYRYIYEAASAPNIHGTLKKRWEDCKCQRIRVFAVKLSPSKVRNYTHKNLIKPTAYK